MSFFSFSNLKNLFHRYESEISSLALVLGFIIDFLTLRRVDYLFDNLLIILYLFVAGFSIVILNLYEPPRAQGKFIDSIYEFLPFTLQFAFGGLFSAFTIFYGKSASFVSGGIFVAVLFALLIGNEFFQQRYKKLVFQVSIYFTAIFFFTIYFLPVLVKAMGVFVFLSSGAISLLLIYFFILLVTKFAPAKYEESKKFLFVSILGIWAVLNFFYFANLIPPIPLSLKMGDVYHLVERQVGGGYRVTGEPKDAWYKKWTTPRTIHLTSDEAVYVFSSVFAPTDLSIKIIHHWQYFDEVKEEWVSANKIVFPIRGGRDEGYRGFSKKESIFGGKWRVDIMTERGQIVGRIRFDILIGDFTQNLEIKNI